MAYSNFIDLRIYELSEKLADETWDMVIQWSNFEKETIGKQLILATDSIGANIAEGNGRSSYIDNKKFCIISRGSLYETKHFLRRAYIRKLVNEQKKEKIKKIIDELTPKLNAYINSLKERIDEEQQEKQKTKSKIKTTKPQAINNNKQSINKIQPATNN